MRFTKFPRDQNLRVGKSGTVLCSAEGYPKPKFLWYKNLKHVETEQDPRFTLLSNGSLLIDPVHESDTGAYWCSIMEVGTRRRSWKYIKVIVYGKFVLLVPFRWLLTIHKIVRPSDLALQTERELYWRNSVVEAK